MTDGVYGQSRSGRVTGHARHTRGVPFRGPAAHFAPRMVKSNGVPIVESLVRTYSGPKTAGPRYGERGPAECANPKAAWSFLSAASQRARKSDRKGKGKFPADPLWEG